MLDMYTVSHMIEGSAELHILLNIGMPSSSLLVTLSYDIHIDLNSIYSQGTDKSALYADVCRY